MALFKAAPIFKKKETFILNKVKKVVFYCEERPPVILFTSSLACCLQRMLRQGTFCQMPTIGSSSRPCLTLTDINNWSHFRRRYWIVNIRMARKNSQKTGNIFWLFYCDLLVLRLWSDWKENIRAVESSAPSFWQDVQCWSFLEVTLKWGITFFFLFVRRFQGKDFDTYD